MELEAKLVQERNDRIFGQLEEAVTVSMEPLDKMFREADLPPEIDPRDGARRLFRTGRAADAAHLLDQGGRAATAEDAARQCDPRGARQT